MAIQATASAISDAAAQLVEAYLDELRTLQPRAEGRAPCFGYGRGGIAYVLLKAGTLRGDRALVQAAQRWAVAGLRLGSRFRLRGWPKASFSRGLTGLHALHALAAHAAGDEATRERALERFVATARRGRGSIELFQGMAGRLSGAAIVLRSIPDPRVRALGDVLAARLLEALQARAAPLAPHGLAHGRPGVLVGLLAWQEVARSLPAAALRRAVDTVRAAAAAAGERPYGTWGHGPAGMAFVFARAHTLLGDARYLAWMREAAERACSLTTNNARLLDGYTGVTYALLAAAEADPAGPWREAALTSAARAIVRAEVSAVSPYGMFSSLGGPCCLALDLLHGTRARVPGFEA